MSAEGSTYTLPIYSPTTNNQQNTPKPHKMNLVDLTASTSVVASEKPPTRNAPPVNPPRWRTTEFYIYYAVAIVVIPIMCWIPMSVSSGERSRQRFHDLSLITSTVQRRIQTIRFIRTGCRRVGCLDGRWCAPVTVTCPPL